MTIKQQGGIFGRNPTFNDVEVEGNLTVGGSPISAGGTMASQDADSVNIDGGAIDGTTIGLTTPSTGDFTTITGEAVKSGYIADFRNTRGNQDAGGLYVQTRYNNPVNSILKLSTNSGSATALEVRGDLDMDVYGSIIMKNAGEGIDFSATSGTGTSELFDDYEEGSYTVSLHDGSSGGNASSTTTTGYYTKVGRVVTCSFASLSNISTAGMTSTSVLYMSLPFSAAQDASGSMAISVVEARQAAGAGYVVPVVVSGNSRARFYGCQSGNAEASIRPAELTSGTSDFVNFTMTYIAS